MNARFSSGLVPRLLFPIVLLICLLPAHPAQASHTRDGAADMFYKELAPYGNWVHHRSYGRVWYPRHVPRGWRPYTDGYWSYTSNYGWLWVSDWVWGWAPFHYGRWVWDDWYGWIWVPGTLWAPAWVFWRYGGGYLSWAPMPPQYIWNPYIGYSTSYLDYDRYVNWDSWVFVRDRDFPRRHHRPSRLIAPDRNRELLKSTQYINNITVINNNIVNQGVPVNHIEQATGRRIKPATPKIMTQSEWRNQDRRSGRVGQEPIIYRPIDIRPSPDVVRQEEQYARQFMERAPAAGERTIERNQSEKNSLPRLPGRLSGKPRPPDYLDTQEPAAVPPRIQQPSVPRTLPERKEDLPLEPGINRTTRRREPVDRAGEAQQLELERQQRVEEERMRREFTRQQKEADSRRQLESQRQSEQDRLQRESVHQQIKGTHRQQQELERQRQDEQRRMEREASQLQERNRQQEQQPYRRQPGELQQQIEQQQRARDEARQIEMLNRQQEQLYRQPPIQRQQQMELQQQIEQQQQNEEAQRVREGLRPQREIIQQPNIQQQPMPQPMDGQPQFDQSGGGRSGRSISRGQRSR